MGVQNARSLAFLVAFFALLTGVMGETVDTDLVGIVIAAVCIAVLFMVIIAFIVFLCLRWTDDNERESVVVRKESGDGEVTSIPTRWGPNHPLYNVSVDPRLYALPAASCNFLRNQHSIKVWEPDRMKHLRQEQTSRLALTSQQRSSREREEETRAKQKPAPQANGQVVKDEHRAVVNYTAVHEHNRGDTPEWLKKGYMEDEKSMDINEEGSLPPSLRFKIAPTDQAVEVTDPPETERMVVTGVRTQVSTDCNGGLVSGRVLGDDEEFTIVDFVDGQKVRRGQLGIHLQTQTHSQPRLQLERESQFKLQPEPQTSKSSYKTRDVRNTTEYSKYSARAKQVANTSQGSGGSGFVPPVSTSTPRSPGGGEEAWGSRVVEVEHRRMRKPHEGGVIVLPHNKPCGVQDFWL